MRKYIKCLIRRDTRTKELLLPPCQAHVGKKLVIKESDQSALWQVVSLGSHDTGMAGPERSAEA